MNLSDLKQAVKCCVSKSPKWEDGCGSCPLLNKGTNSFEETMDISNCVDELISALAEYLPIDPLHIPSTCEHCHPPFKRFGKYYIKTGYSNDPTLYVLRRSECLGGVMIEHCPMCGRKLDQPIEDILEE